MNDSNTNTNTNNGSGGNGNSKYGLSAFYSGRNTVITRSESDICANLGCNQADCDKFYQLFQKNAKIIPIHDFNISDFYHWFDQLHCAKKEVSTVYTGKTRRYRIRYTTAGSRVMVTLNGNGGSKQEQFYSIVQQMFGGVKQQMMSGDAQTGVGEQESTRAHTTIITSDAGVEQVTVDKIEEKKLKELCNTDEVYTMPNLSDRFELLVQGTITVDEDFKYDLVLPRDLFSNPQKKDSANLLLFRNFIYSDLELELRIIVNAPKFGQGRLVCSWFPDNHDEIDTHYSNVASLIQRPHVYLDLNGMNQAVLTVPKIYRRTFIRNFEHESSIHGMPYAQLFAFQMRSIGIYRTGTEQPRTVPYSVEYRFTKLELAGVSFGVNLQMDKMIDLAGDIYPPVKTAEKYLKQFGIIGNQDKPFGGDLLKITPTPRQCFTSGMGVSDAIPLQFDQMGTVTTLRDHCNSEDPKTVLDIARKWGLKAKFSWSTDNAAGDILHALPVAPAFHDVTMGENYNRLPTPLDYVSSGYAFWRGTLEYEYHFVSTPFHTGSIQIQISYNRLGENNYVNANVLTKLFDLGTTTSCSITVPYIYDTPWRRCTSNVQPPLWKIKEGGIGWTGSEIPTKVFPYPLASEFINNTRITVRVINPLVPITNVHKLIDCFVLIRGGTDFELKSVTPNCFVCPKKMSDDSIFISRFAQQIPIYEDNAIKKSNIENGIQVPRLQTKISLTSGAKYGYVVSQADDFGAGKPMRHFHSTDEDIKIKTLLRRNYKVRWVSFPKFEDEVETYINLSDTTKKTKAACNWSFWLPVKIPHHLGSGKEQAGLACPLATIPTLFRHWRGSMRYVIVITKYTGITPVYVSYVPNLGVKYNGHIAFPYKSTQINGNQGQFYLSPFSGNFSELGFATEILLPTVNSSTSISVPFDVMFNLCVTATRAIVGDGSNITRCFAREDVTDISGHLVITAPTGCELEVFQSVGDDFMLHNFVGTLEYDQPMIMNFPDTFYRYENSKGQKSTLTTGKTIETQLTSAQLKEKAKLGTKLIIPGHSAGFSQFDLCDNTSDQCEKPEIILKTKYLNPCFDETCLDDTPISQQMKKMSISERVVSAVTGVGPQDIQDGMKQFVQTCTGVQENVAKSTEILANSALEITSNVGIAATNLAGASNSISETMSGMREDMKSSSEALIQSVKSVEAVTQQFGQDSKGIMNMLRPILDKVRGYLPSAGGLGDKIMEYTSDFIFDLIILLKEFSLSTFAIMIVKYIAKIFFINFEDIVEYSTNLVTILKIKMGVGTQQSKSESAPVASLFGFFVSMISGICKFKLSKEKKNYDYDSKTLDFVFDNKNVSYLNGVMTLVERVINSMVSAIQWCSNKKEVTTTMKDYFQENEPRLMDFMARVDEITNPANRAILNRSDMKARCFYTFLEAQAILKKTSLMAGNSAASTLANFARRILKFMEEQWAVFSCCPVRMEPRVICIEGPSNIGKSFLVQHLGPMLMKEIGWKAMGQNPIFTRAPGRKHWDGYADQPIILYDDWMNLSNSEQVVEQIADLYELKSTCDFMPPKASLAEKGAKGNPRLIILLTNDAFPENELNGVARHKDAIYRRRDIMLKVRRKEAHVGDLRAQNLECNEPNFDHLEFASASNLEKTQNDDPCLEWKNFDVILEELKIDMVTYFREEEQIARQKLQRFCADLPPQIREIADPIANFNYRVVAVQSAFETVEDMIPSRRLEKEINALMVEINAMYAGESVHEQFGLGNLCFKSDNRQMPIEKIGELPVRLRTEIFGNMALSKIWLAYNKNSVYDIRFTNEKLNNVIDIIDGYKSELREFFLKLTEDTPIKRILNSKFVPTPPETCEFWANEIIKFLSNTYDAIGNDKKIKDSRWRDEIYGSFEWAAKTVNGIMEERENEILKLERVPEKFEVLKRYKLNYFEIAITNRSLAPFGHLEMGFNKNDLFDIQDVPKLQGWQHQPLSIREVWMRVKYYNIDPEHDGIQWIYYENYQMNKFERPVCVSTLILGGCWLQLSELYMEQAGLRKTKTEIVEEVQAVMTAARCYCVPVPFKNEITCKNQFDIQGGRSCLCGDDLDNLYCEEWTFELERYFAHKDGAKKTCMLDQEKLLPLMRDPNFCMDSVVGKREFVVSEKRERRNMAQSVIVMITENGTDEERADLLNLKIYDGVNFMSFAQECFDPRYSDVARKSLLNCHHCRDYKLLQFGNDKHHICMDCKERITSCDYCATVPVNNTFYWKSLWHFLRYGVIISKMSYFLKKLFSLIPHWVKDLMYWSLAASSLGFAYMFGVMGAMRSVLALSQASSGFNLENFNKMMEQRENFDENDECMHHKIMDLSEASYQNFVWSIPNGEGNLVGISVYPCKKNCMLFNGDNMDKYRRECRLFQERTEVNVNELYRSTIGNPELYDTYMEQVPPFSRVSDLTIVSKTDLFCVSNNRKYRQIWNRCVLFASNMVGINPTVSKLKILAKLGIGLIGIIASVRGIVSMFGYIKNKIFPEEKEQAVTTYDGGAQRHFYAERQKIKHASLKNAKPNGVKSQSDDTYFETLYLKLHKNTLQFRIYDKSGNLKTSLMCLGLRNRIVAMPKHYHMAIKKLVGDNDYQFKLCRPYYREIEVEYCYDETDFHDSDISDLTIFIAPKTLNDFINITGYFAKFSDFSGALPRRAIFFRGACGKHNIPFTTAVNMSSDLKKRVELVDSGLEELQHVLSYEYSEDGACGSVIMRTGNQRPIIGMHVAGTNKGALRMRGYGVILYREMVDEFITGEDYLDNAVNHVVEDLHDATTIFEDGVFLQALAVSKPPVHIPSKTKIKPSLINDYDGEPLTKPCYLSKRDEGYKHEISPLMAGVKKHGILTKNFKTSTLREITDALYDAKYASMKPSVANPERLGLLRAITGLNVEGYDSLRLDTSAGYPFVLTDSKQKKDYIHMDENPNREERKVVIRQSCLEHLLENEDLRLGGVRPYLPYVDELKDERKKKEKLDKLGSTRVFCMSPLSTTISVRQNFMHFAVAYKDNRLNLQHAVGISRDGPEWTLLANTLLEYGNNIVTLDYSNFGPGYNAGVNSCGHEIITRWTKQNVVGVSDFEMAVLGEEHYNSIHIVHDLVYRQLSGGPSGDALTVVKNGLVNELYLLLAWKGLVVSRFGDSSYYAEFFKNVRVITYGDDAILSVTDKFIDLFNGITISEYFAKFGIVATDAEKSGSMVRARTLLESTFLKSGFKKHPFWHGEYLAPMDEVSITETARWIFQSPDDGLATEQNAEQALRLAYGHGPTYFSKLKNKINLALIDVDLQPILLNWKDLDQNFFPEYYN